MKSFSQAAPQAYQKNDALNLFSDADKNYIPQSLFLTRKEISAYLSVSESQAKKLLAQHGVQPVDLGRGRGKGLRWRTSAVIEVADILHAEAQAKRNPRRVKVSPYSVKGKNAAQLFAEFQRSNPLEAEVCNGY